MDHSAPLSAPARWTGRIVLVGIAILSVAMAAILARPSSVSTGRTSPQLEAGRTSPQLEVGPPPGAPAALGEADGAIPDGVAVSAFDDEVPAVARLDPDLLEALRRATTAAEADGVWLRVNSGWRSPEHQRQLLQDAIAEHGSPEEAARWVATPETSAHVSGDAVDIGGIGPFDATAWLSEHGAAHRLCQIYDNEPWHYELRPDAVDEGCPPRYADPTEDPRMLP